MMHELLESEGNAAYLNDLIGAHHTQHRLNIKCRLYYYMTSPHIRHFRSIIRSAFVSVMFFPLCLTALPRT